MENIFRRKKQADEGKIPPQEVELEIAILGAILIEKDALEKVIDLLNPKCFYKDAHGTIYKAILGLYEAKQPIDILTVSAYLKKSNELEPLGGSHFITNLTKDVVSAAHIETHARIVVEAFLGREIIRLGSEFISRSYDNSEDVFDMLEEFHKEVDTLKNFGIDNSGDMPFALAVKERVKEKEEMVVKGITVTGIRTGNDKLDGLISGWNDKALYVIAGASGMGKSVKGLNYARIAAEQGKRVAVFSLEMSEKDYIDRYLAEEARIPLHDYRNNRMTEYDVEKMRNAGKVLSKLPITIYDNPSATPAYIIKKLKSLIKMYGSVDMAVIDYAQLIKSGSKSSSREQDVSENVKAIKVIAKDFGIPIILLAQVGRAVYQIADRRPNLSCLRESGEIENSADFVGFIYRPSYYFDKLSHPDFNKEGTTISSMDDYQYGLASELIVQKNRAGLPNVVIYENFYGQYSCFSKDPLNFNSTDPFEAAPDNSDIRNLDIPF
jgi:replicative DNA helicase